MARRRAVITGLGAVSGFGRGAEVLFAGLRSGESAVRREAALEAAGLPSMVATVPLVAAVPGGEAAAPDGAGGPLAPGDRAVALALEAAAEAARDADGVVAGPRLAVAVGTTLGGISGFLAAVRGEPPSLEPWTWGAPAWAIAAAHGAQAAVRVESVACSSGNAALGAALAEIRAGRADQVIAGGVDTLSDFVLAGFGVLKATDPRPCRPFAADRAGLNLGEAACFLVVEEEEFARARGARIRAVLAGYGDASDAHHMTGPDPHGQGAARAMAAALADAGLPPEAVDYVSAHGTATVFNDLMEHHALLALLGERARRVPVNSIKGALGHTLGAAGALEALACVRQLEEQVVVPTAGHGARDPAIALDVVSGRARPATLRVALSTSSGFGGTNAAAVFTRAEVAPPPVPPARAAGPRGVVITGASPPPADPTAQPAIEPARATLRVKPGRLSRMDRLCALSLIAADAALADAGLRAADLAAIDPERIGVVVGTRFGCHATNEEYYRGLLAEGPRGASPRLFAYTLPSSPLGELAIHFGARGPAQTVASGRHAGLEAVGRAASLCASGRADLVLVVAVELGGGALVGSGCSDGAVALVVEAAERVAPARRERARLVGSGVAFAAGRLEEARGAAQARALLDAGLPPWPLEPQPRVGAGQGSVEPLASLCGWLRAQPSEGSLGLFLDDDEAGSAAAVLAVARGPQPA